VDEDIRTYLDARRYREAFELLLDRYQHKAFRLAYSMLGDEASAEEMAQDTFLRIWKALPSYRGGRVAIHVDLCHHPKSLLDREKGAPRETGRVDRGTWCEGGR